MTAIDRLNFIREIQPILFFIFLLQSKRKFLNLFF